MTWMPGRNRNAGGAARGAEARPDRPDVTAGEVAAFYRCPREWWLAQAEGSPAPPEPRPGPADHASSPSAIAHPVRLLTVWIVVQTALGFVALAAAALRVLVP